MTPREDMSDRQKPAPRQVSRRAFVITVATSVVGFSLLGWWRLRSGGSDSVGSVADLIRRRLSYLDLEEAGLERFSENVEAVMKRIEIPPIRTSDVPESHVIEGVAFQINNGAVRFYEDTLVRKFLLSSDFFLEGADESRTVQYLGWFDEFAPCRNPFAQLD